MDKNALQLCSRFALQPNELGFCGKDSAPAKFTKCITKGECDGVEEEIKEFIVLNPYIQTIAQITGKDPFSYEVMEAYWTGSDLLREIKPEHYSLLLENLQKQGVPELLIKEIKDKKPDPFIPIHLFNILHVGVGKASGSVPFNLESINNCMIRWGNVLKVDSDNIEVKAVSLDKDYKIREEIKEFQISKDFISDIKVGDSVAVHWGHIAKKLTDQELTHLIIWTTQLLRTFESR